MMKNEAHPFRKDPPETITKHLKSITVEEIIALWASGGRSIPRVNLEGFLNGAIAPLTESELEGLSDGLIRSVLKTKSIRLTNLQLFVPSLKCVCDELGRERNLAVTVNLYYTPAVSAKCFNLHSDEHRTFIYQLEGEKTWYFIPHGESYLRQRFGTKDVPKGTPEGFTLRPGFYLDIPFGVLHEAVNVDDLPSAHFTFSAPVLTFGDWALETIAKGMGASYSKDFIREISFEELSQFSPVSPEEVLDRLYGDFKEFEEDTRTKGKPYL